VPTMRALTLALLSLPLVLAACEDDSSPMPPAAVDVRINEFIASNDEGLLDEDGEDEDWFELYNAGSATVDLTGWHLTDDAAELDQWTLPAVSLPAGGHLVIFASGKNRTDPAGELHTNFGLSAGGEYFGLIEPDGVTVADEYAPEYPPQTTNQAYGYLPDGSRGFLRTPTPGATNSAEAISELTLSPSSGVFTDSTVVTLAFGGAAGMAIHYTTDGTEPTTSSPSYSSPFAVTSTARVRARGFDGPAAGPEAQAFYTQISDSVAAFQSDLPLVVIHTVGTTVPDDDEGVESLMTIIGLTGGTASTTDVPDYSGGTSVDIRGSTSALFPKKQYKLELHDATGNDIDADLLGMGSEEDWVLYAPGRWDRNMIANPLTQRLAGRIGPTELDHRFVEVFLNQEDTGPVTESHYAGIFVLGENIKIDETRVDITKIEPGDDSEPEITGGYIFKIDRPDPDEFSFTTTSGFPDFESDIVVARPKLDDLTAAQQSWVRGYFNDFEAALLGPNSTDPILGYAAYIDVPSWIDSHILQVLAKEPDMLRFSQFMTKDREGKLVADPQWDFDRAWDSPDSRNTDPTVTFTPDMVDPYAWEWWGALFADPAFVSQYEARWAELRSGVLSEASLFNEIDALAAEIENAYPREAARWGSEAGYGSRFGDLAGEIASLKIWVSGRLAYLDTVLMPSP